MSSTQAQDRMPARGASAVVLAALGVAALAAPSVAHAERPAVKKQFPRLGGIQIGTNPYPDSYADPEYQRQLARLDLVLVGGGAPGMSDHAAAIKKLNPNVLMAKYTNITAFVASSTYGGKLEEKARSERGPNSSNAFDWVLRDENGDPVIGASPGTTRANITEYVKPDSQGRRWPEWQAEHDYNFWFKDPAWDVWYSDVVGWRPKFQNQGFVGDFSGGQVGQIDELNAAWRRGHLAHWKAIGKLDPDMMIMANLNWYLYQDQYGKWDLEEYDRKIEGGLLELVMRPNSGIEENRGWHKLYDYYRWTMSYLVDPKLVIFNVEGDPKNYRWFRYTFATSLMGDGFFDYSPNNKYKFGTVEWFDEFDRAGQDDAFWMGTPLEGMPEKAWKDGVYRREFQNAVVLVNPRGNGSKTVTVEAGLRRLKGKQDPAVNDGAVADTIRLADADGIVLVRESYLSAGSGDPARPEPPTIGLEN